MKKLLLIPLIILSSITITLAANDVMCTMEYDPVCGKDGKTYSNSCVASAQHGVEIDYKGECKSNNVKDEIDLSNCVSYFDGCNNCSVVDGQLSACTMMYCENPTTPKCTMTKDQVKDDVVGMPNPASVYCEKKGGTSTNVTEKDGSQHGVCVFPDGKTIDEWELYRSENNSNQEDESSQNDLLKGCSLYYDGCNNCMVKDGKITGCTKRMCVRQDTPKCLKYENDNNLSEKDQKLVDNIIIKINKAIEKDYKAYDKIIQKIEKLRNKANGNNQLSIALDLILKGINKPVFNSTEDTVIPGKIDGVGAGYYSEDARIAPYYGPTYYQYLYSGALDESIFKLGSLEKTGIQLDGSSFIQNLVNSGFDKLSLGNLKGSLSNIGFEINKDKKYNVSIDFKYGSISIYKEYDSKSGNEASKEVQIPSNDKLIALSNDILSQWGIDISKYGTAKVVDMNDYELKYAAISSAYYRPTAITVEYPVLYNGLPIYYQYGNQQNLTVSISLIDNSLESINLPIENYTSANLKLTNDIEKIKELIKIGGTQGTYGFVNPDNIDIKSLNLNNPQVGYAKITDYNFGAGKEYLVPAYIFEVAQKPSYGEYFQPNLVIPLLDTNYYKLPVLYK